MPNRIRHSKYLPFIAIVILVLLAAAPVLSYPMGRDQGMYANIGRSILRGGTPYIDMWDIKPPPIYYIYAAGIALFGTTTASIRAIDFTLIPLGMLSLFLFGEQLKNRRFGLFAALIYGVFYFNEDFQNLTQSDSLVTVPMIWAAYAAYRSMLSGDRRFSWRWALVAGAICGVVLWFKHYYAFFVLALVINRVWVQFKSLSMSGEGFREGLLWRDGLAFVLGGLLTGGSLLLYFWSQGMISEMLFVAQGTAAYNAQGYDFGAFISNMGNYLYFRWLTWHILLILAGLWCILRFLRVGKGATMQFNHLTQSKTPPLAPPRIRGGEVKTSPEFGGGVAPATEGVGTQSYFLKEHHRTPTNDDGQRQKIGWRLVISWLIAGLAFALIQAKGFDTHWIPMLPALALMAADTLDTLLQALQNNRKIRINGMAIVWYGLAVIGLLIIPTVTTWGRAWRYITGAETRVAYFDRFQANDLKPEESLLMAEYLRERVIAGDSLFIWGFRPEVYFMAQLYPATRYQAQFPLVAPWYPLEWREENVAILRAALPPYALILEDDFMPWVTNIDADSHTILQDSAHDELRFWYQAHYEQVDEIGDFIIWRRQSSTP